MKTIDVPVSGTSNLLRAIGALICMASVGTVIRGFGDSFAPVELAAGASGFIFAAMLFGLAAVISKLASIDAHLKAYVQRAFEQAPADPKPSGPPVTLMDDILGRNKI
jgi:hypothetical protein